MSNSIKWFDPEIIGFRNLKLFCFLPRPALSLVQWGVKMGPGALNRFYMELSRHWPRPWHWLGCIVSRIQRHNHTIHPRLWADYWVSGCVLAGCRPPASSYYLGKVMNSPSQSLPVTFEHISVKFLCVSVSVFHFLLNLKQKFIAVWSTRKIFVILGSLSVCDGVRGRVVISGGGSSFVTIIQTHCAQYSGVLVNIKDDTVTQTQAPWHVDWGESHDINIRMLQHQKPPWSVTTSLKCVTSYTSIASIGNFYRIDINSLHFSNHYSLCERQFSFIW